MECVMNSEIRTELVIEMIRDGAVSLCQFSSLDCQSISERQLEVAVVFGGGSIRGRWQWPWTMHLFD